MKKILIVDDSMTARNVMVDTLKEKGYKIIIAENGEEALKKAVSELPDLILLDVVMPGQNGFQICRKLKTENNTKNIKIVMVTSKNQKSDKFWGMKQGADDYLTKPFEKKVLLKTVEECI